MPSIDSANNKIKKLTLKDRVRDKEEKRKRGTDEGVLLCFDGAAISAGKLASSPSTKQAVGRKLVGSSLRSSIGP